MPTDRRTPHLPNSGDDGASVSEIFAGELQSQSYRAAPVPALEMDEPSFVRTETEWRELRQSLLGAAERIGLPAEQPLPELFALYASLERQIAFRKTEIPADGPAMGTEETFILGVTSAVRGEGKTTTAVRLAGTAAANTCERVCLIDLSLGDNDLTRHLGVTSARPGVMNVLEDGAKVVSPLRVASVGDLIVLSAGRVPRNAARVARSPLLGTLFSALRGLFQLVIVDLPAVSTGNAVPITHHLDGVLMVIHAGITPRDIAGRALDQVGRERILGTVLNRASPPIPWAKKHLR